MGLCVPLWNFIDTVFRGLFPNYYSFVIFFFTGTKWQVWLVKLNQCLVQNHYWSFIMWVFVFHNEISLTLFLEVYFPTNKFLWSFCFTGNKWHVWLVKLNQCLVQNHCWSFIMWAFVFTMKFHWHCFLRFVSELSFSIDLFFTGTKWQVWLVKLTQDLVQNH